MKNKMGLTFKEFIKLEWKMLRVNLEGETLSEKRVIMSDFVYNIVHKIYKRTY